MGASPADNANNHATSSSSRIMREESLLRSFWAIHDRSSADGVSPRPSSQDEQLKRDRRGRGRRGNGRLSQTSAHCAGHRAVGHADGPSSPTGCAVTGVTSPLSDSDAHDVPTLPFTELHRDSSEDTFGSLERRQPRKLQRRYSPVTADRAQEMANGLADERQNARRSVAFERPSQHAPLEPPAPPAPATEEEQHKGFRRDYCIGESLRHPSHMVLQPSTSHAILAADTLNKHDFAFVKRSDGSYSYAILAYRSMGQVKNTGEEEECMVFVMNEVGSTKMICKRHWGRLVRLVSAEGSNAPDAINAGRTSPRRSSDEHVRERSVLLCEAVAPPQMCEDGWAPPSVIAFVSGADEECSLFSSVSDKARLSMGRRQCLGNNLGNA